MNKFYHRTNNLDSIASSGRVKALKHLARSHGDLEIEVEPGAGGSNWGGLKSNRSTMSAQDAYEAMRGTKDVDNIFVTKDVLPSKSYGKYVIEKNLKNPKFNTKLNLIANEYITPRELSVRSNSTVYAPEEELPELMGKYRDVRFRSMSELNARQANLKDHAKTLFGKITKSASIDDLYSGSESDVRRLLGRNATIVGSEGIGINIAGASDRDILVPYKTRAGYDRLAAKLKENGFGLQESAYNDRKRDGYKVYSFKDDTRDVDVALVHGGKAPELAAHVRHLRSTLSDDEKSEIIKEKERLQNAWFFRDTRYKNYKRGVDKKLGLTAFHE